MLLRSAVTQAMAGNKPVAGHIIVSVILVMMTFVDGQRNELLTEMLSCFWLLYTACDELVGLIKRLEMKASPESVVQLKRLPVVLEYGNGCVLLFFSFSYLVEGLGKLTHPHGASPSLSLLLSQLAVHCVFELFLNRRQAPSHRGRYHLLRVVFRRAIVSLVALCYYLFSHTLRLDFMGLDAIFTVAMVSWIVYYLWPLQKVSAEILLQKAPMNVKVMLDKSVKEIEACQGVLEVTEEKYWSLREGDVVAAVKVRVRDDADTQMVLAAARPNFKGLVTDLTMQIERSEYSPPPPPSVDYSVPPNGPTDMSASLMTLPPMTPTTSNTAVTSPYVRQVPPTPQQHHQHNPGRSFDLDASDQV